METELGQQKRSISGEIRRRNQELILQAAADEFVKHGYKGTSVQAIADRVNLPKANILYYFKSKTGLYKALLQDILTLWNEGFSENAIDSSPQAVLRNYIVGKMRYSRTHPQESKIFAQEIIQGAPVIRDEIQFPVVNWAAGKASVINAWVEQGLIRPVDPLHLLFLIWGATQFYADFDTEIQLIKGAPMSEEEFEQAQQFLVDMILRGLAVTS
ncbi:TetR family transcriptional regulator C-terminal domain-containing protein [Vibrio fluvialis]|uniref:TetR family transcriptional regulator C-terminal domain-containing protein n=1 Tax=Vibrio fluvialis TaxID=676 RepID=UPI001C9C1D00|nr:TetR family transcriptional regulator C-terminal domain-containing protein [Vibrio fluvialis]MBY7766077.1 TetR family transcriptional regulator C-terminal domain-containing protein [Vibrio fluvialis]MBY7774691.1 TetR family transcriptional regulator C-terminal domain-containing protein [Vibrio fluvialis]MBY7778974.1 TetR family transcriptional regulator C-terminal domain-containing protein [Vibrio fluvialis]MBY7988317.1 TetR family transcriptional regulator C-terminal domain-containing prote